MLFARHKQVTMRGIHRQPPACCAVFGWAIAPKAGVLAPLPNAGADGAPNAGVEEPGK